MGWAEETVDPGPGITSPGSASSPNRPAYTDETLADAILGGADPGRPGVPSARCPATPSAGGTWRSSSRT